MFQARFPCAERHNLLRERVLPFPEGNPRQGSGQKPSRTGSEFARLYIRGLLKVARRVEQHISANSTYALFACCEMSKCIFKAFAVTERGGNLPHAAREGPSNHGNFTTRPGVKFVNPFSYSYTSAYTDWRCWG